MVGCGPCRRWFLTWLLCVQTFIWNDVLVEVVFIEPLLYYSIAQCCWRMLGEVAIESSDRSERPHTCSPIVRQAWHWLTCAQSWQLLKTCSPIGSFGFECECDCFQSALSSKYSLIYRRGFHFSSLFQRFIVNISYICFERKNASFL